jgi:hypothetical protein
VYPWIKNPLGTVLGTSLYPWIRIRIALDIRGYFKTDTKNQYPYPNTRISVKITPGPQAHGPHRHSPQRHKRSQSFQQSSEALARPADLHLSFSPPLSSPTRPLLPPPPTPSHLSQTPAAATLYRSGSLAPCVAPGHREQISSSSSVPASPTPSAVRPQSLHR